jgi:hypothetical protein
MPSSKNTTTTDTVHPNATVHSTSHATKGESPVKKTSPAPEVTATTSIHPSLAPPPTADAITELLVQLDTMATSLGEGAVPLTIAERQRLLRIRPGGAAHATTAVATAARYGVVIPGVSPAQAESDAALAENLDALTSRLEAMKGLVGDMSLQARARLWRDGTTAYGILVRLVPQYPSLQRDLTPMASFLAVTHKDAPTSIRPQQKTTLARSRKAKTKAAAAQATSPASPAPQPSAHAAPEAPAASPAPAASAAVVVPPTA